VNVWKTLQSAIQELRSPEPLSPDVTPVSTRQRLVAAVAIGLAAGTFCWLVSQRPGAVPDFYYPHTAARHFLEGRNPYAAMAPGVVEPDLILYYPFTSVLAAMPFAFLSLPAASALFLGLSSALLAFCITRDGLWRIHIFASAPFVLCAILGQFAPLVMVMAFVPAAGFLAALKPNLGLALLVRQPAWQPVAGCAVLLGLSLLLLPSWPADWLGVLRTDVAETGVHRMPARETGGFLLLLAVLWWRRAAGRLLLAMSLVPQLLFFYDALPLWLIPRTRQQSIAFTACSQAALLVWYLQLRPGELTVRSAAPFVVWMIYVPALLLLAWQHATRVRAGEMRSV
jgi:hypothetical protein